MHSQRARWLVVAVVFVGIASVKSSSFLYESTAQAGTPCIKDDDCYTPCKLPNGTSLVYKCVTATQLGAGFSNRCAWPTLTTTSIPTGDRGSAMSTGKGLSYIACGS